MVLLLTDIKNHASIDLDLGSWTQDEVKYEGEKAILNVFTSATPSKEVLDKVEAIVLCLEKPSFVLKKGGSIKDIEVNLWNCWIKAFRDNCKAPIFIRYKPNYTKRYLIYNTQYKWEYGEGILTGIPGSMGCIKDVLTINKKDEEKQSTKIKNILLVGFKEDEVSCIRNNNNSVLINRISLDSYMICHHQITERISKKTIDIVVFSENMSLLNATKYMIEAYSKSEKTIYIYRDGQYRDSSGNSLIDEGIYIEPRLKSAIINVPKESDSLALVNPCAEIDLLKSEKCSTQPLRPDECFKKIEIRNKILIIC